MEKVSPSNRGIHTQSKENKRREKRLRLVSLGYELSPVNPTKAGNQTATRVHGEGIALIEAEGETAEGQTTDVIEQGHRTVDQVQTHELGNTARLPTKN